MAKSTRKVVSSIIQKVNPYLTDDEKASVDKEWVLDKSNDVRAKLIQDLYDGKRSLSDTFYQQACCLEVECRNITCDGIDSGDKQWYVSLPKLADGIENANIKYFGLTDFKTTFERKTFNGFRNGEGALYTGRNPMYTITGGREGEDESPEALLKNMPTSGIKYLCIIGIFDGPTELCNSSWDQDYPIPTSLVWKLEMLVVKDILSTYKLPADVINDAMMALQNDPKAISQANKNLQE